MSDAASDLPRPDTVIVTGAAGWLGQNLVRALTERNRVRCLVRDRSEASSIALVSRSVEAIEGDVLDPASADRLFDGMRGATVFHCAGVVHPHRSTRELFDVNVGGTEIVVDRAKRAEVGRFVHVSSNSPFGANPSPAHRFDRSSPYNPYMGYGRSKREAEEVVLRAHEREDIQAVVIRPPWFYGPFQPERQTTWFRSVRRGAFPVLGDGTQRRSMVFTGNLVDGLLRAEVATAAAGGAFWVSDGEPHEMREILQVVRRALEAEGLEVTDRQPRLPAAVGHLAERIDAFVQDRGRYIQAVHVLGELKDTIACDISDTRAVLGYEPRTSLFEGMRASIRWCLDRGWQL